MWLDEVEKMICAPQHVKFETLGLLRIIPPPLKTRWRAQGYWLSTRERVHVQEAKAHGMGHEHRLL
jgi:hypothetical protein